MPPLNRCLTCCCRCCLECETCFPSGKLDSDVGRSSQSVQRWISDPPQRSGLLNGDSKWSTQPLNHSNHECLTEMSGKLWWINTCGVNGALLTSMQRSLDQFHGVLHVVGGAHGITRRASRLLQQPQHVRRTHCVPPHAVNTPAARSHLRFLSECLQQSIHTPLFNSFFFFFSSPPNQSSEECRQQDALTLSWSTHRLSPPWPWLQSQPFQWHSCSNAILKA